MTSVRHALILTLTSTFVVAAPASADHSQVTRRFVASFDYEAGGDMSRALNEILQVLRTDPRHYLANLRAGWLYHKKGRYADSVDFYTRAVKAAPASLEARLGMTLPMMAAGRWGDAEQICRQVLKRAPQNYLAASRLAWIVFQQGRYSEAVTLYQSVLAAYPSDTEMRLGLGWAWLRAGQPAKARTEFNAVLMVYPQSKAARTALAAL